MLWPLETTQAERAKPFALQAEEQENHGERDGLVAHNAPDQLREMRGQRRVRSLPTNLVDPVEDDHAQRDTQRSTLGNGHGVPAANGKIITARNNLVLLNEPDRHRVAIEFSFARLDG